MSFFDNLVNSVRDSLSVGNIFKRVLQFFVFGFLLGLTKLISGLDQAGADGSGAVGFFKAFFSATRYGLGVGHATVWDVARNIFVESASYFSNNAWGTLFFSGLFFLGLMGFWFQPISLLMNFFDGKGKEETGDKHGNATTWFVRLIVTFFVVMIISCVVFYSETSESIAGGENQIEEPETFMNETINNTEINDTSLTNTLNMLTGGA